MISIDANAAEHVKSIGARQKMGEEFGLRFGLRDGGCSGFFYLLDFEPKPDEDDVVHLEHGVRIFIHPMHLPLLAGSTIRYKNALLESGFFVDNPNVKRSCGCGESVSF